MQDELGELQNEEVGKLLRAEEVKQPEVHAWQFIDLEVEGNKKQQEIDEAIYQRVKKELEPQLTRQAAILKKEAFEEAKQEGFEEGYQAGFSTGQTQGLEKAKETARETLEPQVEIFSQILEQLARPQELVADKVFLQLAKMSLLFAEKLVGEAIEANPQRIARIVAEAVALLPNPEAQVGVELNPEDLALVEYYQQENSKDWNLSANAKLARGVCKVKSLDTVVIDDWQEKLQEMLSKANLLVEDLAASDDAEDEDLQEENLAPEDAVAEDVAG